MRNFLIVADERFELTPAYVSGALAMRAAVPFTANPHRPDSQKHLEWDTGHMHEAAREHVRFGQDVLAVPPTGQCFALDASVPRGDHGAVDRSWYCTQLGALPRTV